MRTRSSSLDKMESAKEIHSNPDHSPKKHRTAELKGLFNTVVCVATSQEIIDIAKHSSLTQYGKV